jgi:hypothetical protein
MVKDKPKAKIFNVVKVDNLHTKKEQPPLPSICVIGIKGYSQMQAQFR